MGFKSVLKNVWRGVRLGIEIGANFSPMVRTIDTGIDAVEEAMPDDPGADKHATVVAMSDAALDRLPITAEQKAQIREVRDRAIVAAVTARNAVAESKRVYQELDDLIESFKKAA